MGCFGNTAHVLLVSSFMSHLLQYILLNCHGSFQILSLSSAMNLLTYIYALANLNIGDNLVVFIIIIINNNNWLGQFLVRHAL